MKILVLNCGSSSVKYQLIDMEKGVALAKGLVDRIGLSGASLTHQALDRPVVKITDEIRDHTQAVDMCISILLSAEHGVIADKSEIAAVGHRMVHGGEKFTESVLVTSELMDQVRDLITLAPLHNPHNIRGIEAATALMGKTPQVAVFDTAFHHQMPPYAYIYGTPYSLYTKHGIRRYGFHGTSHYYVANKAAEVLGKPIEKLKIVTCHLGNGASMAAVDGGISVDTSMGFTPLEGLLMGTRSGDCDPAVILHVMEQEKLTLQDANTLLNKKSGLLGVSGLSADVREVLKGAADGNANAKLALEIYCYRVKKYIGAYMAALGGLDILIFTAGVGENAVEVRRMSVEGLECFGIKLDYAKNKAHKAGIEIISTDDSRVKVMVIPTNEELVIAQETVRVIKQEKH